MNSTCCCEVNRQAFGPSHHNVDHHEYSLWRYLDGNLDVLLAEVCDVHLGQEVRSPQKMVMYMMVNKIFPFFSTSEIPAHSWQNHSMFFTRWPECHVFPHLEHINICLNTKLSQNETRAGRLEFLAPRRPRRDWLLNVGVDTLEGRGHRGYWSGGATMWILGIPGTVE